MIDWVSGGKSLHVRAKDRSNDIDILARLASRNFGWDFSETLRPGFRQGRSFPPAYRGKASLLRLSISLSRIVRTFTHAPWPSRANLDRTWLRSKVDPLYRRTNHHYHIIIIICIRTYYYSLRIIIRTYMYIMIQVDSDFVSKEERKNVAFASERIVLRFL